jgi:hypothetical protein
MKKTSPKKVSLSRETLRNLQEIQLQTAAGGYTPLCPTTSFDSTCIWDSCPNTCSYNSC